MGLALLAVGSLALLAMIGVTTYRTALLLRQAPLPFNPLLLPLENLVRLLLIGFGLALGASSGLAKTHLGWSPQEPLVDAGLGAATAALLVVPLNLAAAWAIARYGKALYSPLVLLSILPKSAGEWALVLLALLPAVFLEELLFRSLLVGGFSAWLGPWLPALLFSLIFGLLHIPQGPLAVAATALVSALLSWLFLWRGSLVAPLVAHYLLNLLQLLHASRSRGWLQPYQSAPHMGEAEELKP